MEELNKTQIILLTLLVSFVTSIATGITTVTLMDQAPPAITQTLNRVIERTVERVIQPASVVTNEVKVVVKEEDAIVSAFEKNRHSVVLVEEVGEQNGKFVSLGTIIQDDNVVLVPTSALSARAKYQIGIGEEIIPIEFATTTNDGVLSFFIIGASEEKIENENTETLPQTGILQSVKRAVGIEEQENKTLLPKLYFASSDNIRPGQTAIAIGGNGGDQIFTGIISRVEIGIIIPEKEKVSTTDSISQQKEIIAIHTDIILDEQSIGGILLNLDGEVIGTIVRDNGDIYAIPSSIIIRVLENLRAFKTNISR